MLTIHPVALEGYGIRLEPLSYTHEEGLAVAVADGKLCELWFRGQRKCTPISPRRSPVRKRGTCCPGRSGN
jgi:hypothetical protein